MNCKFHPQKSTEERCFHCKVYICPACIHSYEKHTFCSSCYDQAKREADEYNTIPSPIQDSIHVRDPKNGSGSTDFLKFIFLFGIGMIIVVIAFYFIMYISALTSQID